MLALRMELFAAGYSVRFTLQRLAPAASVDIALIQA
jgi:hypothetical protein